MRHSGRNPRHLATHGAESVSWSAPHDAGQVSRVEKNLFLDFASVEYAIGVNSVCGTGDNELLDRPATNIPNSSGGLAHDRLFV